MRRKNRKWLAMAAGGRLPVMGSAYRWAWRSIRPTVNVFDPIEFDPIEREGIRRPEDERAREAAAGPKSTRSRIVESGNSDGGIVERGNIRNENIGDKIVEYISEERGATLNWSNGEKSVLLSGRFKLVFGAA